MASSKGVSIFRINIVFLGEIRKISSEQQQEIITLSTCAPIKDCHPAHPYSLIGLLDTLWIAKDQSKTFSSQQYGLCFV